MQRAVDIFFKSVEANIWVIKILCCETNIRIYTPALNNRDSIFQKYFYFFSLDWCLTP